MFLKLFLIYWFCGKWGFLHVESVMRFLFEFYSKILDIIITFKKFPLKRLTKFSNFRALSRPKKYFNASNVYFKVKNTTLHRHEAFSWFFNEKIEFFPKFAQISFELSNCPQKLTWYKSKYVDQLITIKKNNFLNEKTTKSGIVIYFNFNCAT